MHAQSRIIFLVFFSIIISLFFFIDSENVRAQWECDFCGCCGCSDPPSSVCSNVNECQRYWNPDADCNYQVYTVDNSCTNLCPSGECSGGSCVETCTPVCSGAQCGQDDNCGGTCPSTSEVTCDQLSFECGYYETSCDPINCGTCGANQECSGGVCVESCTPVCSGNQCGQSDTCGGTCPSTDEVTCGDLNFECDNWGTTCGTINCGTCGANQDCSGGVCVETCTPTSSCTSACTRWNRATNCNTWYSADDSCFPNYCASNICYGGSCCVPVCSGDQCGQDNTCGGTCPNTDGSTPGKCGNPAPPECDFASTPDGCNDVSKYCDFLTDTCKSCPANSNCDQTGGCEADLTTDDNNCGSCGNSCGANQECVNSVCEGSMDCTSAQNQLCSGKGDCYTRCGNVEADSCGIRCPSPGNEHYCEGNSCYKYTIMGLGHHDCGNVECREYVGLCSDGCPPSTCTDNDGDGYGSPASPACTYPTEDCNDNNAAINPGASEVCNDPNTADNDCDGKTDCEDTDCAGEINFDGYTCCQNSGNCVVDKGRLPDCNSNIYICEWDPCRLNVPNDCATGYCCERDVGSITYFHGCVSTTTIKDYIWLCN